MIRSERHPALTPRQRRITKELVCVSMNGEVRTLSGDSITGPFLVVDDSAWILCGLEEYVCHVDDLIEATEAEVAGG